MYGTRSKNPVQHQLYNVATQDAAAFHSMLAFSARQHDSLSGSEASRNALAHSMQTLRLVYERVRDPAFKCEDGLVLAIALLAFAEVRKETWFTMPNSPYLETCADVPPHSVDSVSTQPRNSTGLLCAKS